jgi:hypothetical protein
MPTFPIFFAQSAYSPVGAVSRSADKLDIFAVASDGNVWTAAWEPDFSDWHGWYMIGGATFPPGAPVTAVSRSPDKLDIFATDFNGKILTSAWQPGFTQWTPWRQVAGGTTAPGAYVGAVSRSAGKLDIFAVGNDQTAYTAAWEPDFGADWHGWWPIQGPIGLGLFPPGAPIHAVSRSTDKLDIFAVTADAPGVVGTIVTSAWEPGFPQWSPWRQVTNGIASPRAHVTAVSRSADKLDIFVVSPDIRNPHGGGPGEFGLVFTAAWEPGPDDWRGWWTAFAEPNEPFCSDGVPIGAVCRSKDKIDIFAAATVLDATPGGPPGFAGVSSAAWPAVPSFAVPWSWSLVAGGAQSVVPLDVESIKPPVTAVSRNTDKLDIFFIGTDGNIWTSAWEPAFGEPWNWRPWRTILS